MKDETKFILEMASDRLDNYIIPGLASSLIGAKNGKVRLFEQTTEQMTKITPHSHRFDLTCCVLEGSVVNKLWKSVNPEYQEGSEMEVSTINYLGRPGAYQVEITGRSIFRPISTRYEAGQWYSMRAHEIHSIAFAKGAKVLIFEGPTKTESSVILEPIVNGKAVRTFKVEPWMFQEVERG